MTTNDIRREIRRVERKLAAVPCLPVSLDRKRQLISRYENRLRELRKKLEAAWEESGLYG